VLHQPKTPRDYQEKAIKSFFEYFKIPRNDGNPLITVPTGGGKSLICAEIIKRIYDINNNIKILCITHTKEIVSQNAQELQIQANYIKYGIYSSGLNQKCLDHGVTFAGIQSIWDLSDKIGHVDLVIIDEAHLLPNEDTGRYRHLISNLKTINKNLRVFGLTATPWRLNGGSLIVGDDKIFDSIIYEISIVELIDKGALVTVVTPKNKLVEADFSELKVNKANGDFVPSSSETAISKIVNPAISESISLAKQRTSWIIFCPTIKILEEVMSLLNLNGISAKSITGKTSKKIRENTILDFKKKKFIALVSVDALTTGFNAPNVDCMICLRPTQSSALWVQMVGRAMRTYPGKDNALLLDYGGNIARHGAIDKIQPPKKNRKKKKNDGEVTIRPVKICPRCDQESAPSIQACPFCGYEYPILKNIEEKASNLDVLSTVKEPFTVNVNYLTKSRHKKDGMPDSVKVGYVCDNGKMYFEWLCPEHTSLAKNKTILYFYDINISCPKTVDECLSMDIPKPRLIIIDDNNKYPIIIKRIYE
jgi:DNA repair protein RadD